MNPSSAVITLLLTSVLAVGQGNQIPSPQNKANYHFKLFHGGLQIGNASYERITTPADRRTLLTIDENVEGVPFSAVFDTTSKHDGTPEKKIFHGVIGQRPFSSTALFSTTSVDFTIQDTNGATHKSTIAMPPNAVIADASEAWFAGVTPKKGDSVAFVNFDVQNGKWEQTTTTYIGDEETKVGSKMVSTHHVHVKSTGGELDMFLDDSSDIVAMDQLGSLRMERAD